MEEKRRFTRVRLDGDAHLAFDGGSWPVELVDLSLKGAMLECDRILPIQSNGECQLTLELDDSDIIIPIQARVTHHQGRRLGIEFLQLDVDAMQHVRRMLELNAGDQDIALDNIPDHGSPNAD